MSYNDVIPWSGFAMSPWGRSGGIAPFDQLFERRESFPKGFSFWGREMNYQHHYDLLIEKYGAWEKPKGVYVERHRKLPGCMGGKYVKGNAFYMSARAHFTAHVLLTKIHPEEHRVKSAHYMMGNLHDKRNGKAYAESKEATVAVLRVSGRLVAAENQRLGKAIFAQTLEERRVAGYNGGKLAGTRGGKTQGDLNATNGVLIKARAAINWDNVARVNGARFAAQTFEERSARAKLTSAKNWKCAECEMKGSAGSIGMHHKGSGHTGKEKINVQS